MKDFFLNLLRLPVELIRTLFSSPGQLFSSGRRLLGFSLPARVSMLVAVFLVLCVVASYVAYRLNPNSTFSHALLGKPYYVAAVLALTVVIPVVVYFTLKAWLEGEASPFEDIRKAWEAGIAELDRLGLDISRVPIFLVVGTSGDSQERSLFQAARVDLNLKGLPQGPAALHWYANPDAIYVICTNVGSLSRLATIARASLEEERARVPFSQPAGASIRGTIVAGSDADPEPMIQPEALFGNSPGPSPQDVDIRGTMIASNKSMVLPEGGRLQDVVASSARSIVLPMDEAAEQDRRLEYLCSLIRRARRPLCPVNGILTLLPFRLIQHGPREGVEIQRAAKRDLATILRVGKLRCPVTAIVTGMEHDAGFRELVRRVGRDRAAAQRFGKGFSIANPPIPERLEALCAHACGAFEDWVYALFREKDSLSRPGNTKLYSLLCTIRRNVQTRLTNILVDTYGSELDRDSSAEHLFFGGCYFAATGETDDRQAFVKGVFDKLPEEQAELQWTEAAQAEDAKLQRLAHLIMVYDFLAFAGLVGLIVYLTVFQR